MPQSKDWQVNQSVLECNKHMLQHKISCDVVLMVGLPGECTRELAAHKYMLVSRSPVFEAMLCGQWAIEYQGENGQSKIPITDVDYDALQEFLRYVYCEMVHLTGENVLAVLYASKKYLLQDLAAQCFSFLKEHMDIDNVCLILNNAVAYSETDMINACVRYIARNFSEMTNTHESWNNLTQVSLIEVLKHDEIVVDKESDIFKACMNWARHQCVSSNQSTDGDVDMKDLGNTHSRYSSTQLRGALGSCFYRIRFPSMQPIEFAKLIGESDVMTSKEKSDIYYYLLTLNKPAKGLGFDEGCRVKRCQRFNARGKSCDNWWTCSGKNDAVSFQCDIPVKLVGVSIYGGRQAAEHDVFIRIIDDQDKVIAEVKEPKFASSGSMDPVHVFLDKSVQVEINMLYHVVLTATGPLTHYGMNGQPKVKCGAATFTFSSCRKSGNGTSQKCGQIPELLFIPEQNRTPSVEHSIKL